MTESDRAKLEQAGLAHSPLHRFMGFQFIPPRPGQDFVEVRLPFSDNLRRMDGEALVHAGAIATLIDIAGVWALTSRGGPPGPTVDMRVDFLRPAACEEHVARARVVKMGRRFAVTDVRIANGDGRLVALGRGLFSVDPDHIPPHLRQ